VRDDSELLSLVRDLPRDDWHAPLVAFVIEHARTLLHGAGGRLVASTPLWDQGLDSMSAIELRNVLVRAGVKLDVSRVVSGPSPDELAALLAGCLEVSLAASPDVPQGLVALDPELPAWGPVVSHLLAAVCGALVVACLLYVGSQLAEVLGP
jgi:aryl carrier-like protein